MAPRENFTVLNCIRSGELLFLSSMAFLNAFLGNQTVVEWYPFLQLISVMIIPTAY